LRQKAHEEHERCEQEGGLGLRPAVKVGGSEWRCMALAGNKQTEWRTFFVGLHGAAVGASSNDAPTTATRRQPNLREMGMTQQGETAQAVKTGQSRRRAVHDVAAAIIAIRMLSDRLAEHLPTVVAMARARHAGGAAGIPVERLDEMPALPDEIGSLCDAAERALRTLADASGPSTVEGPAAHRPAPETTGLRPATTEITAPRVLLVEDQANVRYVLTESLRNLGCTVTSVADGEEALKVLEGLSVDLMLVDLRLPGISGWEMARRLRQGGQDSARDGMIVGLTASPLPEDARSALAAGMDAVLVKPVREEDLQALLARLPNATPP
jgi:CheY-like chemotaxis protein